MRGLRHLTGSTGLILLSLAMLIGCGSSGDGTGDPTAATWVHCRVNRTCPVADAGPNQSVLSGTRVTLDGSQSFAFDLLTYEWTLTDKPARSTAILANPTSVQPTFTADLVGQYTAKLIVLSGGVRSRPSTVVITAGTGNLPPVADAGPDRTVPPGTLVTLDGTGSADPNGTPIARYEWILTGQTATKQVTLSDPSSATPSFTAYQVGRYEFMLKVSDGTLSGVPARVTITAATGNIAPVANAGADRSVSTGSPVTLNGSGSFDANGDSLTYGWRFVSLPAGSTATLANARTATPTFTPDFVGFYVLMLLVFDGQTESPLDFIVIEATPSTVVQQAYVKASNTRIDGAFGWDVALSGDTLAVGNPFDSSCATGINGQNTDTGCFSSGAVHVFTRTDGVWSQQAYVKASNTGTNDNFGKRLVLSGDTLAVAASSEPSCATGINGDQTNNGCSNAGAVYVFTRTGGVWSQQAYVKASNTQLGDYFGSSVALSGDTLAVGAIGEGSCGKGINGPDQANNGCTASGAVYVFTRTAGVWSQQAYVKASNTEVSDVFGANVALSGDTLAVGAIGERSCATGINGDQTNNGCGVAGAVYVFTRTGGVWSQQSYVKASNSEAGDIFGSSVALSGDTLAVGAYGEDSCATGINGDQSNNCSASSSIIDGAGAVYVFTRTAGVWSQQAYIKASNTKGLDTFGGADAFSLGLALSGDTLAVGASLEDSCATGINGDQTNNGCYDAGAVYLFTRTGGVWSQQDYVKAPNTNQLADFFGGFGYGLALSGDTLAVGFPGDDSCATGINGDQTNNSCRNAGAVYVYKLP